MYVEGDVPYIANGGYGNSNGMWGDNGWWVIIIFALLFGWGRNGNGYGSGGSGAETMGYELGKLATTNDVASGFSTSTIMSNLNDLKLGQQTGFASVQQTLCQGFGGINTGLVQQGYETRLGINALGSQLSQCCCDLRAGQADIKYTMAKDTCDITNAIANAKNEVIGFMTQQELTNLRAENQALRFNASQSAQNAYLTATLDAGNAELIRRLGKDNPVPAYVVPNPNYPYYGGYYNGYGCGCNN